jgi:hypothetical protein
MVIDFGEKGLPENESCVVKDKSFAIEIYHWGRVNKKVKSCFVILTKNSKGRVISRTELKDIRK